MKTLTNQELKSKLEAIDGVPICGSNLSSVVTNRSDFIREIHYRIGDRLYIENAD
jgi:hypothetical protein